MAGQRSAHDKDGDPEGAEAGQTLGRYRLLKKIARGGMAEVFAARSFGAHGFEKTVAIKRILPKYGNDPQFVRMMVDEAKITVLLNHPNVAQILELCEQDGDYFIVMEFVPGMSLSGLRKQLLENNARVPDLEACYITLELLQGLHAAHEQKDAQGKPANIIHRDVSPQNVLVSFDGHVKVIDFGIARARTRLELTEVGTIKGKLRYLAPEMIDPARFMRSGDFDHRVDIFAAGIVLWELIASRTLYQGDDEMAVYDAITDADAPDLYAMKACDKDLARIVKKALARFPDERFQTAEELADELRAYLYRRDPKFTHKRVAALLDQCFPREKAEMLALERGVVLEHDEQGRLIDRNDGKGRAKGEPEARRPDAKRDDAKRDDAKRDERAEKKRSGEDKPVEAQKPLPPTLVEPHPIPVDAPTQTHLHGSGSGNDQGAFASKPKGEAGEVLTVMTLVSRKSQPALQGGGARPAPARDEPEPARIAPEESTRTSQGRAPMPPVTTPSTPSALGLADETPHTSESLRGMRASIRPARGRMVLLSAAAGIVLAVVLVLALELTGGDNDRPDPTPRPTPSAVKLVVRASAPGAIVSIAGRELPAPAEFAALPGDVLEVVVRAPGFAEKTERVLVSRTQMEDLALDVQLRALDAPSSAQPDAGASAAADAADAGAPQDVADAGPRAPKQGGGTSPDKTAGDKTTGDKKVVDKKVVDKRTGKLKVTSKPTWALVTIDGKSYGETPVVAELPAGKHKLVVTGPSKKKIERTVTVRGGDTTTEAFDVQ